MAPGRRRLIPASAACLLVAAVPLWAPGSAWAGESAWIQAVLERDGTGLMSVNSRGNPPDETWSWETCTPELTSCTAFGSGRTMRTTGAEAETVFRATSSYGAVAQSPIWHGNPRALAPPGASGELRANELVTPAPGEWSGGWEGDVHLTQLAACRTAAGADCITLTDYRYSGGCPSGAAVIDRGFVGEHLRVADWNLGPDPVAPGHGVGSPYSADGLWTAGPTLSVAIVGRIAAPAGPRAADCGPPKMPFARVTPTGAAKVQCLRACRVVLIARKGTQRERRTRSLPDLKRAEFRLSRASRRRLGPGPVRMTVKVDGERVARRLVGSA